MFKKIGFLLTSLFCLINTSACSFSENGNSNFDYIVSFFDDDTEGNGFLINRPQDLKAVTNLEKTDKEKLWSYDDDYFANHSLIVFKVIDNVGEIRGIKNYRFGVQNIIVNINPRKDTIKEEQSYYFYLIKINKKDSASFKRIKIYEKGTLFGDTKIQPEEYYDFLNCFDLNDKKGHYRDLTQFIDIIPHNQFCISVKNNKTTNLQVKPAYLDLDIPFQINCIYKKGTLYYIEVLFDEQSRESYIDINKQLHKLEFARSVDLGLPAEPTDSF